MIVGLVTSVQYDDFLRITLPTTCNICDVVYVLTKPEDPSIEVARQNSCKVIEYDGWQDEGASFNKSGAICLSQQYIHEHHPESWVMLADADIVFQPSLRMAIRQSVKDTKTLHSVTRVDFRTPQKYREGQGTYYPFPFSGYCQIYRSEAGYQYPPWSQSASHCDCFFRDNFTTWTRLPGFAAHLGSDQVNWCGRKSERWVL